MPIKINSAASYYTGQCSGNTYVATTTLVRFVSFYTSDSDLPGKRLHACLHEDDVSIGLHGAVR